MFWIVALAVVGSCLVATALAVYAVARVLAADQRRSAPSWRGVIACTVIGGALTLALRWVTHEPLWSDLGWPRLPWLEIAAWSAVAFVASFVLESLLGSGTIEAPRRGSKRSDDWARERPFRLPLKHDIWERVRAISQTSDPMIGRERQVEFLTSILRSQPSGSILIAGPRGVGKTTLVDRAIIRARAQIAETGDVTPRHRPFLWRVLGLWHWPRNTEPASPLLVLNLTVADLASDGTPEAKRRAPRDSSDKAAPEAAATAAEKSVARSEAAPARAEPSVQLKPETVLRAMVRKVYSECHDSRPTSSAARIGWMLTRRKRKKFLELLEMTYNRAASRTLKRSLARQDEDKSTGTIRLSADEKNVLRTVLGYVPAAVLGAAAWASSLLGWEWAMRTLTTLSISVAAVASWPTVRLAWEREWKNERSRKAAEFYEFDYGSSQIAEDLQRLLSMLTHPAGRAPFVRVVFVFDELDKLAQPLESLSAVLYHFKNLYTLSDALFVFITDDSFYRQWQQALRGAARRLDYAPAHTYFAHAIYLRKPDFDELRHFVYGLFADDTLKLLLTEMNVGDHELIAYLVERSYPIVVYSSPDSAESFSGVKAPELWTQLWMRRDRIDAAKRAQLDWQLQLFARGKPERFAVAWIRMAAHGTTSELEPFADDFDWSNREAVLLLHRYRDRFPLSIRDRIDRERSQFEAPAEGWQTGIAALPMNFTDFTRYVVFEARNHYFDIQRHLQSYLRVDADGSSLEFDPYASDHTRVLKARFQEMIELVYESFCEPESGQDFYNQLLLESLYRIFQDYEERGAVSAQSLRLTASALSGDRAAGGAAISTRMVDEINHAVERLLQMLQRRGAITFEPPLEDLFLLEAHGTHRIGWTGTCEPIVSRAGIPLTSEEAMLARFWEENATAYLEMQHALKSLWIGLEIKESWRIDYRLRQVTEQVQTLIAAAQPLDRGVSAVSRTRARTLIAESPSASELAAEIPSLFGTRAKEEPGTVFKDGSQVAIDVLLEKAEAPEIHERLYAVSRSYCLNVVDRSCVAVLFVDLLTAEIQQAAIDVVDSFACSVVFAARRIDDGVRLDARSDLRVVTWDSPTCLERLFDAFQEYVGSARASLVAGTDASPKALAACVADVFGRISREHPWIRQITCTPLAELIGTSSLRDALRKSVDIVVLERLDMLKIEVSPALSTAVDEWGATVADSVVGNAGDPSRMPNDEPLVLREAHVDALESLRIGRIRAHYAPPPEQQ